MHISLFNSDLTWQCHPREMRPLYKQDRRIGPAVKTEHTAVHRGIATTAAYLLSPCGLCGRRSAAGICLLRAECKGC